jgi:hypothetical protein
MRRHTVAGSFQMPLPRRNGEAYSWVRSHPSLAGTKAPIAAQKKQEGERNGPPAIHEARRNRCRYPTRLPEVITFPANGKSRQLPG